MAIKYMVISILESLWWQMAQNQTFSLRSWELDISLFSSPDDDRRGSQGMSQDRSRPQRSVSGRGFGCIFSWFYIYSAIFLFILYLGFIFPPSNPVAVILTWKRKDWWGCQASRTNGENWENKARWDLNLAIKSHSQHWGRLILPLSTYQVPEAPQIWRFYTSSCNYFL